MTVTRIPAGTGGSYSDGVAVAGPGGTWIHVSGQVAFGQDGKVTGDVAAQAHGCFDHIERILAKFGADLSHVVKITSFLTDLRDYGQFSQARAERFGQATPASAAVQVADLLVGAAVEVEAVAFLPES